MLRSPRIVRSRSINASADAVWNLLADLSQHEALIPLTTMQAPARVTEPGDIIVARTAKVLVDRMTTQQVDSAGTDSAAPGWVRVASLRKDGPLLFGQAGIAVRSEGPSRSTVLWAEDVSVPALGKLGRFLEPLLDISLGLMGQFALARLAAELRKCSVVKMGHINAA